MTNHQPQGIANHSPGRKKKKKPKKGKKRNPTLAQPKGKKPNGHRSEGISWDDDVSFSRDFQQKEQHEQGEVLPEESSGSSWDMEGVFLTIFFGFVGLVILLAAFGDGCGGDEGEVGGYQGSYRSGGGKW